LKTRQDEKVEELQLVGNFVVISVHAYGEARKIFKPKGSGF
jgi:hypothetical protein